MAFSTLSSFHSVAKGGGKQPLTLSSITSGTLLGTGTYKLYNFINSTGSITLNGAGNVYFVIIGGGG